MTIIVNTRCDGAPSEPTQQRCWRRPTTVVIQREFVVLVDEFLASIRADPRDAMPHRLAHIYYLGIMRRPLLRAFFTSDMEMLGKLASGNRTQGAQLEILRRSYARVLVEQRVLRTDVSPEELAFVYRGIILGFILSDPLVHAEERRLTLERKGELLMDAVDRAFPIERRIAAATYQTIAVHAIELFGALADSLRVPARQAYESDARDEK